MNVKKLALFGGAAVVIAGGLIYSLGIYPPASSRDGQGAIGQRQVYRADQPADASVTPGAAPVAMKATAEVMKIPALQNGQIVQVNAGMMYRVVAGNFVALTAAQAANVNAGMVQNFAIGQLVYLQGNMMPYQVVNAGFAQLYAGQIARLQSGVQAQVAVDGMVHELSSQMATQMRQGITSNVVEK